MRVNAGKTQMICVSGAVTFTAEAFIGDGSGGIIQSTTESIKILGFHLSSKPGVLAHVTSLRKKFRKRLWVILNLRELGFTEAELVKVYVAYVRPVADYCAPAYHSLLTTGQSNELERMQKQAAKLAIGWNKKYEDICSENNITTLKKRREDRIDKFIIKTINNPRYAHWFPLRESDHHNIRDRRIFRD